MLVQNHQAVHLTAAADTGHVRAVKALEKLRNALHHSLVPVFGILLAPAGLGKFQGIFFGDHILDPALGIHQQQLYRGSTQVDTDIQLHVDHSL